MELLRELSHRQDERGYLDEETLREISRLRKIPLFHLEGLVSFYPHFRRSPPAKIHLKVCRDVCCEMAGNNKCLEEVRKRIPAGADVEMEPVSCLGRCDSAPALMRNDIPLAPVSFKETSTVLEFITDLNRVPADEPTNEPRNWTCDPYRSRKEQYGTVKQLASSMSHLKQTCLDRLTESGLRGMGGAGFPTGKKWELVAEQPAGPKYVICNADESEPGTFKDRVILEELPHLVIEGMILAGLAAGAEKGIIFLRHEYTREKKSLEAALARAKQVGVLGENAAGSNRPFDIEIFVSPGGYILGEETALLEALEDKRGEPRNKPPYPVTHGLWSRPTLINNVETFALATSIIHNGADWWKEQGRGDFAGLKFVSVSGDVAEPGVYEIPLGLKISEVIELAGGIKDNRKLLAFLPGGASSNFLTAAHADAPMEFDSMKKAGSMLGTGALIVIAEGRDLFSLATNLVRFFRNESCGKCVPCRIGSEQAVQILESVSAGSADARELEPLTQLAETLEQTSICGLGQVAINPAISMLRHFPDCVPSIR